MKALGWVVCLALLPLVPASPGAWGQAAGVAAGAVSGAKVAGRTGFPVQWRMTQGSHAGLRPGQEFVVAVQATIAAGWHLYAADEPEDGPPPLEFHAESGEPVTLVSVGADRPERGLAAGSAAAVNFYQGQPRFRLRLRAGALQAGVAPAVITIRYQACNERMCLPPRTATLALSLRGRP